uniref:Uncharacterized protein n=1 Tax=Oryza glumipatula TaxID=40148 RepID=A0A0D9YGU3_9ORYZ
MGQAQSEAMGIANRAEIDDLRWAQRHFNPTSPDPRRQRRATRAAWKGKPSEPINQGTGVTSTRSSSNVVVSRPPDRPAPWPGARDAIALHGFKYPPNTSLYKLASHERGSIS